jgi:hypothetical protein
MHSSDPSSKFTYDFNPFQKEYNQLNDSLSNYFKNTISAQQASVSFRSQKNHYDYCIGINLQLNNQKNHITQQFNKIEQQSINFFPVLSFNYISQKNSLLYFLYSGNTIHPSLRQLQPVLDNSNPLYLQLGNPNLKPSYIHNLNFKYTKSQAKTVRSTDLSVNASLATNKIVTSSRLDSTGRQISQPLNVNGSYEIIANISNSASLKEEKLSMNSATTLAFNREIVFVDGYKSYLSKYDITQEVISNYAYQELFNISLGANLSYNITRNNTQKYNNLKFLTCGFSINGSINIPLGFNIGGSLAYTHNNGRTLDVNRDVALLNVFISKTLFKAKQAQFRLQVFDLLKQNININRHIEQNYIEDVQIKSLQRFFMIGFSYFFKPATNNR